MADENPPQPPTQKSKPRGPGRKAVVVEDSRFKYALWFITGASLVAVVVLVALAFSGTDPGNPHKATLANACDFILRSAIPTVFGLLGGRSVVADRVEPAPPK